MVSFFGSTTAKGLSAPFVTPEDGTPAACATFPPDSRPETTNEQARERKASREMLTLIREG